MGKMLNFWRNTEFKTLIKAFSCIFLVLCILCVIPVFAYNINITPEEDTYALKSTPTTAQGSDDKVSIISHTTTDSRTYMMFNFSDYTIYSFINATLYLNRNSILNYNNGYTYKLFYCNDTFDESTLTWNNQGTEVSNCHANPFYSTTSWNYANGYNTFNFSGVVLNETSDDGIFTIKMTLEPENDATERRIWWDSKEASGTSEDPYINMIFDRVEITLNSPTNNFQGLSNTNHTFNISSTSDNGLQNITLYINEVLNETQTWTGYSNETTFEKAFSSGDYNWSVTVCDNRSICEDSETRDFEISSVSIFGEWWTNETIEGSLESFTINITTPFIGQRLSSGNLIYNETAYSGTITSLGGDNYTLSRNLEVPSIGSDTNFTFYWNIILLYIICNIRVK